MDQTNRVTLSGRPAVTPDAPAPDMATDEHGMHKDYWVLSPEERAKGFIRPVRNSYRHVGPPGPRYPLSELSDEDKARYASVGYVKYEQYPPNPGSSVVGRFWTQEQLDKAGKGCGVITTMHRDIAETYARNPQAYGSTYCVGCKTHLPVGVNGEFVWVEPKGGRSYGFTNFIDTDTRVGT